MTDYVVYHNPERMGSSVNAIRGNPFAVSTQKRPKGITGDRVWLITRETTLAKTRPCTYYLAGTFVIRHVGTSRHPTFATQISGKDGTWYDPMIVLNNEPWFSSFKTVQGNFAWGFQPITTPAALAGLRALRITHAQQP